MGFRWPDGAGASPGARLEAVVSSAYRLGDSSCRTELWMYPMDSLSTTTTHQRPWRLSTSTRCPGSITWTIRVSVPRPSLTFTQVDVHFVRVLGPVALGVSAGGESTVAGGNGVGGLLVGRGDPLSIVLGVPRMPSATNTTTRSTGTGQELRRLLTGAARWPRKHEHRGHTDATLATFWPHSGHSTSDIGR